MVDPKDFENLLKDFDKVCEVLNALVSASNKNYQSISQLFESLHRLTYDVKELRSEVFGIKNLFFSDLKHKELTPAQEEYNNLILGPRSKTIYIIGSGPSLNKVDVSSLKDSATLSLNRSYVAWPEWGFAPTFYVAIERLLTGCHASLYTIKNKTMHPYLADWKNMLEDKNNKFLPSVMFINQESPLIGEGSEDYFLGHHLLNRGVASYPVMPPLLGYGDGRFMDALKEGGLLYKHKGKAFSKIAGLPLPMQQNGGAYSVILAYMMGAKRVVLLGIDAHYSGRQESIDKGKDVEHFHPDYFDPDRFTEGETQGSPDRWHSETPWKIIKDANLPDFEIISSSPGSKINNIFEYRDLQDLLKEDKERKQNEKD